MLFAVSRDVFVWCIYKAKSFHFLVRMCYVFVIKIYFLGHWAVCFIYKHTMIFRMSALYT
jgi:hypothetical protein